MPRIGEVVGSTSIPDAIVVGAGIIGATIAQAMRSQGMVVDLLDGGLPMAGTKPSGGHLKPSWFGGMKKTDYEPAMELLDTIWGLTKEQFTIRPVGITTDVFRVDTDTVVSKPIKKAVTVTELRDVATTKPLVVGTTKDGHAYERRCRLLVVSTGVWAGELVPGLKIHRKQGISFRFNGVISNPFILPWAPYKQVVAHQQDDSQVWVGDGTAVLSSNWTDDRTEACLARCSRSLGTGFSLASKTIGLRPYCATNGDNPCLLEKIGPAAWVATGAGKSGTIAAGWAARRIINAET